MSITEREIMSQQEALEKTFAQMSAARDRWRNILGDRPQRYVFMGCGSSYMLAKSAQRLFAVKPGVTAMAIAGGDYLLNPAFYAAALKGSTVVFLSRSGMTSEMIRAAKLVKAQTDARIASLVMKEACELVDLSDVAVAFPWAYDESVCQTRAISNFYVALLMLSAFYDEDTALLADLQTAIGGTTAFLAAERAPLAALAGEHWTKAIVLADGPLCGIAEEASLAFTEIAMIPGGYHRMLDYRHGPMVLSDPATLTLLLAQPGQQELQSALLADVKARGGKTVVLCPAGDEATYPATWTRGCVGLQRWETYGLRFIQTAQLLALAKAEVSGVNPDQPKGLTAWIRL